ncbi:myosin-10 [Embiotoca jacksoni]|uniref:myosin-10 n=1 Tax=Embiotoca jacksoni TaxID=100190 RepID=UPI003703A934
MASCLVPEFPAVMVALEHLKDLDQELKEERVPFAPEASIRLTEITAAITELEADRRAAHEHLEVETIENSKLRHQITDISDQITEEIVADVAAARASDAEEIEQLRRDLEAASKLQEEAVKRRRALLRQSAALREERRRAKDELDDVVVTLNDQISGKYRLQTQLDQTLQRIEELKAGVLTVGRDIAALRQNAVLDRDAFGARKDELSRGVKRAEDEIKEQKLAIRRRRKELCQMSVDRREAHRRLSDLEAEVATLEGSVQKLEASRRRREKLLEREVGKHEELRRQIETLKVQLRELEDGFRLAAKKLKKEIATLEIKIEKSRASGSVWLDDMAHVLEMFKRRQDEKDEVKVEHLRVSRELERTKLDLEERIANIVKHSKEIKEMEKQVEELLMVCAINARVFQMNRDELRRHVEAEKKKVSDLQEEKLGLQQLLEEAKRRQAAHVAQMTSDITSAERRYEELRQEEAELRRRHPRSADVDSQAGHMAQLQAEYRKTEGEHQQELERRAAEVESVRRSNEEKLKEVEEKEEILKKVEAEWDEEKNRYERLMGLNHGLRSKMAELNLSIEALKEETGSLLRPREEMKSELEELRASQVDALGGQAAELRAVELSVYDDGVKLEQVAVENSRLHLRIAQMTEDVSANRRHGDGCRREARRFERDTNALLESLRDGRRDDASLIRDRQSSDGVLLASIDSLANLLTSRKQQSGRVRALLHRQMLDYSRRLGDTTTTQQSG